MSWTTPQSTNVQKENALEFVRKLLILNSRFVLHTQEGSTFVKYSFPSLTC